MNTSSDHDTRDSPPPSASTPERSASLHSSGWGARTTGDREISVLYAGISESDFRFCVKAERTRSGTQFNMSQPSRPHRGQRDRNGDHREHREHRDRRDPHNDRRDPHNDRPPSSDRSSSQPPHTQRSSTPPHRHGRDAPSEESKCTHICSRRGIVLICSVLTNALVLICVVAAQMVMSGMSSMGGLAAGSFNINSMVPFEGTELQQVRELDMQYSQMRAPGIYGGVAFSLTMGVLSLLFVVSGNKPAHRLPTKLLAGQFLFLLLGSVGYVVAVGLYLHFVIRVNATDVCKRRERLYARQGYTWMNCDVGGADAAVALFALITAILYGVGCFFTGKTIRGVRRYRQEKERYEASRRDKGSPPQRNDHPQRAPLRSDTTAI
ncbi:hypothetical protein AAFF_G00219610 [Aldrovandia affinis]|uniref:MARVEL domain-containing protein n=1 Tax=Aldrovandia affinis TaxID=143900 RepID=A0AAD7RFY8_9TELE|nr:hypothetical protein AAFF_G00219610 [Aldrovandia affinis]